MATTGIAVYIASTLTLTLSPECCWLPLRHLFSKRGKKVIEDSVLTVRAVSLILAY